MKKRIVLFAVLALLTCLLAGCGHSHEWKEATCDTPKTCVDCGETEGEALGHTWEDADCIYPKTCSACGKTEGDALGHSWVEATCEYPQYCSVCGNMEPGEPFGHDTQIVALRKDGYSYGDCKRCGQPVGMIPVEDWASVAQSLLAGDWKLKGFLNSAVSEEIKEGTSLVFNAEEGTLRLELNTDTIIECPYSYVESSFDESSYMMNLLYTFMWNETVVPMLLSAGELVEGEEPELFICFGINQDYSYWVLE